MSREQKHRKPGPPQRRKAPTAFPVEFGLAPPSFGEPLTIESPRRALARTFLERSSPLLARLASRAPTDALKRALAQPTPVDSLAHLLSDLAPLGMDIEAVDPLAEAMARGVAIKRELLEEAGGAWSATQVANALGISRQAVDKRRTRGKLLAVPSGTGDYLYPRCQFRREGVLASLEKVLAAFRVANPWTRLSALLAPARTLRGKSILQVLEKGDVDGAVAAARSIGDSHDLAPSD